MTAHEACVALPEQRLLLFSSESQAVTVVASADCSQDMPGSRRPCYSPIPLLTNVHFLFLIDHRRPGRLNGPRKRVSSFFSYLLSYVSGAGLSTASLVCSYRPLPLTLATATTAAAVCSIQNRILGTDILLYPTITSSILSAPAQPLTHSVQSCSNSKGKC